MMVMFVLAVAVLATWPVVAGLHQRWTDWDELTYTHGYLIAAVCIYLLWRANFGKALPHTRRWSGAAMAMLGAFGLLWTFSTRAGIAALDWLIWPVMMLLAIAAAFGRDVARRNLFAIGYLYFATPLWASVNGLFQWATVYVVRGMLRVVGIPAHFSGSSVQIPSGTFEIAGGCSGLSFVMVALALGALMGELRGDGWRTRVWLLLVAGALAVVTNWIRVFSIILAGYHSDMRHYLVAESHYGYGWALFCVAMAVFFMLERRFALVQASVPEPAGAAGQVRGAPVAGVVLMLAAVAGYQWTTARPAALNASPDAAEFASAAAGDGEWQPLIQDFDLHQAQRFRSPEGLAVERHRFVLLSQKHGKELGGYGNDPLGGLGIPASREVQMAHLPATLHEVQDAAGTQWLIAVSYSAGLRYYASPTPAQMRGALDSMLQLRSSPGAVTVWRTSCDNDCPAAQQRLEQFIASEKEEGQGT